MSDLGKTVNSDMKVVACPGCGKMIQKSRSTMSEIICSECKYKFNTFVQGDFVMYYNPSDGDAKEFATIVYDKFEKI